VENNQLKIIFSAVRLCQLNSFQFLNAFIKSFLVSISFGLLYGQVSPRRGKVSVNFLKAFRYPLSTIHYSLFKNTRGSILIISFTVLYVIVLLAAGFSLLTIGELTAAQRYRDSARAFWLAEAGVARFLNNPELLDHGSKEFSLPGGSVALSKHDGQGYKRLVTAAGTVNGMRRRIRVEFPGKAPVVFDNAVSSRGNLSIEGNKTAVTINSRLRLGGTLKNKSKHSIVLIEDKKEKVPAPRAALIYPDADRNGTPDEFADFVEFNRNLVASYNPDEVVYLRGDDTGVIVPGAELKGKKIVYFEGSQGKGDAVIHLVGAGEAAQNLTVISTGTVTLNLAGKMPASSALNIIAWSGYSESSVVPGLHNGVIYTHGVARFDNIYDNSVLNGNVIANGGIEMGEIWSRKTFNYKDIRTKGALPPGFEGLVGARAAGFEPYPSGWREI